MVAQWPCPQLSPSTRTYLLLPLFEVRQDRTGLHPTPSGFPIPTRTLFVPELARKRVEGDLSVR